MSTASFLHGVLQNEHDNRHLLPYYTVLISLCGFAISVSALMRYHGDVGGLILFALAGTFAQMTEVELFKSSRSFINLAIVIYTASIIILGVEGAILISFFVGVATLITIGSRLTQRSESIGWVSIVQRVAFNIGTHTISTACGSYLYLWMMVLPQSDSRMWHILAIIAFVVVNESIGTVLLMMVIHLQTGRRLHLIWSQDWQWSLPITTIVGVIGGGGVAFAYQTTGLIGLAIFMLPVAATGYAFRLYIHHMGSYVERLEEMNTALTGANIGLLQTISAAIDAYDIYTFGHSTQVARYASAIAEAMGLSKEEQSRLLRGGLIHDVGKIGVTDAIIGKKGRLTQEEYEALKLHTLIGAEIVSQMPQFSELVPLVRHHHERWDGRGYPDGLKGEENTLGARIMCVADSVEAMLSDRPYQSTRSLSDVIAEVKRCSGTQFDPKVVEAFLEVTKTHGEDFFVNSASTVARQLKESGAAQNLDDRCYIKKSMISLHLKNTNESMFDH